MISLKSRKLEVRKDGITKGVKTLSSFLLLFLYWGCVGLIYSEIRFWTQAPPWCGGLGFEKEKERVYEREIEDKGYCKRKMKCKNNLYVL